MGRLVPSNEALANQPSRGAARHASRSLERRAAATACEALTRTPTIDKARRMLEEISDPAKRDAALAVLEQLRQAG